MRIGSIAMFVLAVLFGSGAVVLANMWLANQTQVQQGVPAVAAKVEDLGTIVVAAKDLSFGDTLQPEVLREIPWSRASLPEGAFSTIADLTKDGRRVALTSISPNETILKWKVSGAGARASLSNTVTEGMRAVAIRVDDVVGIAGFVLPGDRVDLLYTRNAKTQDESSTNDVLVQNVRVLAIDQVADQKNEKPTIARVVTVEVEAVDAQKIALAQQAGSISLSLRAAGSLDNAQAKRVVEEELVSNPSVYMAKLEQRDAAQMALEAKLNKVIDESNSTKEKLVEQLSTIEKRLKGDIANAGAGAEKLREQFNLLQDAVKSANGKSNEELRKRLQEFEASLLGLKNAPPKLAIVEPASLSEPEKTTVSIGVTRAMKRDVVEVPSEDGLEVVQ
jgi:pilus assembly protein CpaB